MIDVDGCIGIIKVLGINEWEIWKWNIVVIMAKAVCRYYWEISIFSHKEENRKIDFVRKGGKRRIRKLEFLNKF